MKSLKKLFNTLSVLLLGTSTSLNAQTPPQKPQPAPQTKQRPPASKAAEVPSKANNYGNPVLKPDQVIEGLLRLIDSVHKNSDLTVERIKQTMGIRLLKDDDDSSGKSSAFANQLPNTEWVYSIDLFPGSFQHDNLTFFFRFVPLHPRTNRYPPSTSICHIDLDAIHQALLNMGYQHVSSARPGEIGLGRQYRRDEIFIDLNYVGESKDNITHDCLSKIRMY